MPTPTPSEFEQSPGYRVLFGDDDAELRGVMQMLLEDHGYQLETAQDGREGWIRLCTAMKSLSKGYDLIITDLDLPRLDGVEFIRTVRKVGFRARVMVYTGKLSPEHQLELKALAVDAAVEKGIDAEILLNVIR